MELEGHNQCNYDYISVYDGTSADSPLLGKLCGNLTGIIDDLRSTTSNLFIKFHSDHMVSMIGFNATVSIDASSQTLPGQYNIKL